MKALLLIMIVLFFTACVHKPLWHQEDKDMEVIRGYKVVKMVHGPFEVPSDVVPLLIKAGEKYCGNGPFRMLGIEVVQYPMSAIRYVCAPTPMAAKPVERVSYGLAKPKKQ